ncbi:adenylate kinase [Chloroflexota bacterium]
MNVILLGAPGAGKGTQAVMMAEKLSLVQVASGDLFRKALGEKTELGLAAKEYMDKGALVPDSITIRMVLERINQPDCAKGVLFDGFPRTVEQAIVLDEALADEGKPIDSVVYIKVGEEELISRLGGRWICRACQAPYHEVQTPPQEAGECDRCGGELYQRADDKSATVKKRLGVFTAQTAPLVDYYASQNKLIKIDGMGDVAQINNRIITALEKAS